MSARGIVVVLSVWFAAGSASSGLAAESGLERARVLFRENRWNEARDAVRNDLAALAPNERDQGRLLLGLSYVKEAELYHGLALFASKVGLDYMTELAATAENRDSRWLPLFTGLYQLSAGRTPEAEKTLAAALATPVSGEWSERAKKRLAAARGRTGGLWEESPAQALLSGRDLDAPDAEDGSDPQKVLRFYDPLWLGALERVAWERAATELTPLANEGTEIPNRFARFHAGLSRFFLGDPEQAATLLGPIREGTLGPAMAGQARLLVAAASWNSAGHERPEASELAELWQATTAFPEVVLLWTDIGPAGQWKDMEPFHSELAKRLAALPSSWSEHPDEVVVGRWGLAALRAGVEPGDVLARLSQYRNHANKNKIQWNDPLLLVALSAANYENNDYAQALETLFELSKTFSGLRGLQWNLQGVYAARQKAAGDARIAK